MKKIISALLLLTMCLSVLASCGDATTAKETTKAQGEVTPVESNLDAALAYVHNMYKDKAKVTASDYKVVGQVMIDGVVYVVTWTVDVKEGVKVGAMGEDKMVTVDVDEKSKTDVNYKLTATVTDQAGKSVSKTYEHTVPKYDVKSFKDYEAAEKGASVVVEGVVSGIIAKSAGAKNNAIFLQDANGEGGYYVFGMKEDPIKDLKLKLGMTVSASGVKDIYNGTHEVKDAKITVESDKITPAVPVDFTEIFKNAKDLKDKALVYPQGMLVTIKGVEVTGQDKDGGYYKFKLGALESYVRISGSTSCLTPEEKETFIKNHDEHFGYEADVTGLISVFNGAFYLVPATVDAYNYGKKIEKTPEQKVEIELGNLSLKGTVTKNEELTVPSVGTNFSDVKITWKSNNAAVVVKDGKLVVTMPNNDTVVEITATVTCGDVTKTKVFKLTLQTRTPSYEEIVDILYALELGEKTEQAYRLFGKIVKIDTPYSDQYKNVTVTIEVAGREDKTVTCFRMKGEGADKLKVGDFITVEGKLENYNKDGKGIRQLSYGKLIGMGEIFDQSKIVENAYALQKGESMAAPTVLQGVVTKIVSPYSEQYKNVTVVIVVDGMEDKPIECFRMVGDKAANVKVGDTITVFGMIKNYNGKVEFDSKCQLVDNAEFKQMRTLAALYALADNESLKNQTLTGVVTKVDTPYNDQYKNVTVTIEVAGVGKYPVSCFRLKGEGADTIKVGDTVTVKGNFTHYVKDDKNVFQFGAGCEIVKLTVKA